jgi:hypothetical protein
VTHGTRYSYDRRGCRCDTCRTANSERKQRERIARLTAGTLSHGTRAGYDSGCRCGDCKAARRRAYPREKRMQVQRDRQRAA